MFYADSLIIMAVKDYNHPSSNFFTLISTMAKLKIVNNYDSSFVLNLEEKEALFRLLTSESFLNQIAEQASCQAVKFTELLFQPVPYSTATPKGMPAEFEKYHASEDYIIINVPPNFMFKAKIFKPSRLCAIYQKINSNSYGRIQELGVRSQESGVRSQESGVRSQESGVRSQESGVRSQESEAHNTDT